jgi:ADP-ribose pyrophosphatase
MYNTQKSNLVYKSQWLQVYEDSVRYKDDNSHSIKIFNRIKVNDTVIIIPIFQDGSLLMVEAYRHGAADNLLEFPGGFIEENEDPTHAAKRELFEETKYSSDSLELINWFYTWPGRTSQKNYVFVARGLKNKKDLFQEKNDNDNNYIQAENERDIKIHKLPREQITSEIKNGRRIKSSPIISALFFIKEV